MQLDDSNRITIVEVAQYAGVSTATVSRVINKTGPVLPETAAKVYAAIEALNYKPNAAARGLASRRTNAIGLLVDEINSEFFQPMLRGIEVTARASGMSLLISSTGGMDKATPPYPLGENNTDGLIIFADSLPQEEILRLHKIGLPMVLLHRSSPPNLNIPCVTVENKIGARRMVDYLIEERGYRKIAFLEGPDSHEDAYWRKLGYQESLAAHNIPFDPKLVSLGGFDEAQAHLSVSHWVEQGLKAKVIFAADDDSAIGAMIALKEAELRIPEDIALVGFDDIRLAAYLDPPLTTVRAPIEQAARIAVEQLVKVIHGEEVELKTLLPTELVIRRSCGCC
ncbi:MAG: LacI family transcriptional regulator [Chloroflexota bacterium]|nr:LacI family transcriptional regulator [Chloroflexota bacterium]NOG65537.1 LacI family DNA-binding transcriptional regulator [Chloroflexota bacterium]GIK65311.1 MAG: LacI family transcriptional regulator [Chloroflexota bacterium]